ncbi:MAG: extracellular solute-binding protein [Candidatus Paceibacteria bacterium]
MKLRPFELVMVTVFGVMGLVALVLLSTYSAPSSRETPLISGSVLIWGTVDSNAFYNILRPLYDTVPAYRQITYVQKNASTFDSDLINALADGVGPDILFLPHEQLVQYRGRIQPIAYRDFPLTDFRSMYLDGAEIFAMSDGVYAYPVAVDPLVLYWNRDILASYNYLEAPRTWEILVNEMVPTLIQRDFNRTIIRSPLAFGEYRNVQNAFSILSLLLLQGGSQMVSENGVSYQLKLDEAIGSGRPFTTSVGFYIGFASPSNALYSWNRSKALDRDEFLAEDLVFYFGKGSEAKTIAQRNPNLNFSVAEVPQAQTSTVRRTYGTFYGLALMRASTNKNGAFQAMQLFGGGENSKRIADAVGMAPAHRSQAVAGSNDVYGRISYTSALVARGWLNPNPTRVDGIFTQMVEDVLANRSTASSAASDAIGRLRQEY